MAKNFSIKIEVFKKKSSNRIEHRLDNANDESVKSNSNNKIAKQLKERLMVFIK